MMIDTDVALRLVQGKPWHHDFEIIPGVRTHGTYNPEGMWNELRLPANLSGLSVADVGASNGYFSFEARKRGARVVAFDYRHKDNSGFGLAQHINGLHDIEHHHVNILDIKPELYGEFDVVLALGLFYHTSDPYLALANCAALSRKRLMIESYCLDPTIPEAMRREPVMRFIPDPERFPKLGHVNNDRSNFWGFTSICLRRMTEDVGFTVVHDDIRGERIFIDAERAVSRRDTRLWLAYDRMDAVEPKGSRDDPNAWTTF